MTTTYPDGTQLEITRQFTASPDRIFDALTDPVVMTRWIWGANASGVAVNTDPKIGGRWSAYMDAPEGDDSWPGSSWGMRGLYAVVDAPERLVYTINWDAPVGYNQDVDPSTLTDEVVVVDLVPRDGGTEMVFRHLGIPDDGVSAPEHAKGIDATLDTLEQVLNTDR